MGLLPPRQRILVSQSDELQRLHLHVHTVIDLRHRAHGVLLLLDWGALRQLHSRVQTVRHVYVYLGSDLLHA